MHGVDQVNRMRRLGQEVPRRMIAVQRPNQGRDPVQCGVNTGEP